MRFPVMVEAREGRFTASLLGASEVRGVGSTRDQAIARLRVEIRQRIDRGELLSLEVEDTGVTSQAGTSEDGRRRAVADARALRERLRSDYGEMADSTQLIREDRAR